VIAELLFHSLPCIITSCLIAFNVLKGNGHSRTEKKYSDQRILVKYAMTVLKATDQEQTRIHI